MKVETHFCLLTVGLLLPLFLISCSPHYNGVGGDHTIQDDSIVLWHFCDVDEAEIDGIIEKMTLKEKIAQMYIVGVTVFPWFDLYKPDFFIKNLGVGGVFVRPMSGVGFWPEWTAENMNKLQAFAMSRQNPIPLFVSIDQEGGVAQAMSELTGGTDQPGNLGLGATFDPASTRISYGIMGEELSSVGINTAFAPVSELMVSHEEVSMYTRCFGELTSEVSAHVKQAVIGFNSNKVIATAKHFPSHSTAPGDEHFKLTVNSDSEETVRALYLPPFIAAIDANVDMIMATHSVFKAWENNLPTTFSYRILTGILREELGFDGVIVTDDVNMGAIMLTEWEELPDLLAIWAGVDMVVDCSADSEPMFGIAEGNRRFPYDVEGQINYVMQAVADGRLSVERIDESVRRILRAKMKYCLFENPYVDVSKVRDKVHTPDKIDASLKLHEKAITLVRDDVGLIPLALADNKRVHVVCPASFQMEMYPDAAWGNIAGTNLYKEIKKINLKTTGDTFIVGESRINATRLVRNAKNSGADFLIIGTYNALYYDQQTELVRKLLELGMPTIVVATGMPYDLLAFPGASTYLATYSNRDLTMRAAARVIFGLAEPQGRLPVSIPGLYEVGWSANK